MRGIRGERGIWLEGYVMRGHVIREHVIRVICGEMAMW